MIILTRNVVTIGSCTSTGSVNVRCHGMELCAVLVSDDGASSGSCISSEYNSALKKQICEMSRFAVAWKLTLKTAPQIVVPVLVKLILCFT